MTDEKIVRERVEAYHAALKLAIAERTGREPRYIDCLDLHSYSVEDDKRAAEIFDLCWRERGSV